MPYHTAPLPEPDRAPTASPTFTGQVTVPNGTAAAPGIAFASNASTGLLLNAGGTMTVVTSGVARATFDMKQFSVNSWLRASGSAGGQGMVGSNAYYDEAGGWTLRYAKTHASIGACGWIFNAPSLNAVGLFLNDGAVTDGQPVTPSWKIVAKAGYLCLGGNDGSESLRAAVTAGAVNRVEITGATAGVAPTVAACGADASIHLKLQAKGTGTIVLNNLPTSSAGLPTGGLWNDGGTLKIA